MELILDYGRALAIQEGRADTNSAYAWEDLAGRADFVQGNDSADQAEQSLGYYAVEGDTLQTLFLLGLACPYWTGKES